MVSELDKNPDRKFIYVEIAFFSRWWNQQTNKTKDLVRNLVNQGRLEFTNGGWSMNDEATTYYADIIDNLALGLDFIKKEFGDCARPKIGWQVDPFGHSREQGSIFAQFGYDGVFIGRDDMLDELVRAYTRTREMVWKSSPSLGKDSDIFNGLLPIGYATYPSMCFDQKCTDDPVIDNPESDEYNVEQKVTEFLFFTGFEAGQFRTKNLIMTFGADFEYSNALRNFKNLDKLIYHVNKIQNITKVNAFYSTPSCYLYSLYKSNISWPVHESDFLPYAHRTHSYWTGFYTSRAALKDFVRRSNNFLQSMRHISLYNNITDDLKYAFFKLQDSMGIVQHHDAVSGTENQHTANDYSKRLANGIILVTNALSKVFLKNINNSNDLPQISVCMLLNITKCLPIENKETIILNIYNPLATKINTYIRFPLVANNYAINQISNSHENVDYEIVEIKNETKMIPERNGSQANYEMVFYSKLPALGFAMYLIEQYNKTSKSPSKLATLTKRFQLPKAQDITIQNEYLKLAFDNKGNLKQISSLEESTLNLTAQLNHNFCYYKSKVGDNKSGDKQASGAYIFRPQEDTPVCFTVSNFTVYKGKLYQEMHQVYTSWLSQSIRLYSNETRVEFEWLVGSIDVQDGIGKEVIFRINSDLKSNKFFSTDSNGRQILKRKRDFRPSIPDYYLTERVSGNYYPINSRIFLQDEEDKVEPKRQITLVTDRSQGGSSLSDGSLELMIHRRILHDDGLGADENLNELGADGNGLNIIGKINLIFNTTTRSPRVHRELAHRINSLPLLTFITNKTSNEFINKIASNVENLNGKIFNSLKEDPLPPNIHLLTMQQEYNNNNETNSMILRLEHFYEINEDPVYSNETTVDLQNLFNGKQITILNITELSLGANMNVEELNNRLVFKSQMDPNIINHNFKQSPIFKAGSPFMIEFKPFQIRTFRVYYSIST